MKLPYRVNRLISRYFILFCLVFSLFSETWAQTYFNDMEDTAIPVYWIGQQSIDSGQAFSGIHRSVTDSLSPYGFGMEMPFPEEKRGSNTFVNISAWVKSHELSPNAAFVITVTEEGQELFWERISLDTVIKKANTWYKFTGAFTFPASVTKEAIFKCFLWNIDQKTTVAIDDLQIRFELLETPTFLPPNELLTEYIKPKAGIDKILFSNHFYLIGLDGLAISFLSKDYEPIALFPLH